MNNSEILVGLDVGGSKTRGIVWAGGEVRGDVTVGSANVQNVSTETARATMAQLLGELDVSGAGRVLAGAGGVDTDADAAALADLIAPHVPGAAITVVHDTRLLLAAGGTETGVAVIAGTGSAAWGVNAAGRQARAGGWGYLLGDEGSGYWFGREAVRHSLHRMDLGLEPDDLTSALLKRCALASPRELIAHFHGGTTRTYWASLSPVVFDAAAAGNRSAAELVDTAGALLAGLADQCATLLDLSGPIVLGSGVGSNQPCGSWTGTRSSACPSWRGTRHPEASTPYRGFHTQRPAGTRRPCHGAGPPPALLTPSRSRRP